MVTSGAIALGMRLMELPTRPRSIDELQAASAVGQGTLFRAYESRLAERDVHAAQVLLTSFDLSIRISPSWKSCPRTRCLARHFRSNAFF